MPITFKDIERVPNGAQFYNADLHVHSFGGSHDVKDSTMTVEAIIDAAVNLGLGILSITDHNNDANVTRSLEYAQKYTGQILVLPGVEITTAHGHLLVYFSPSHPEQVSNLLGRINLLGKRGAEETHTAMSMADVINEAERLGGITIAAHIDRKKSGFEAILSGYPNWKKDILTSRGLHALEVDDPAHLIWYSESDEPTSEGGERMKLLQARATLHSTMGRPNLAHVQGSDAHSLSSFAVGRGTKILTRFKLDELSYSAFRTALADPEARVRTAATIPRAFPRVLGMQITGGFLDSQTYHFSDNLNCFIGGRGTGKSSALQTLAHALGIDSELDQQDNCPGTVIAYCEDANGIKYRYEKVQGAEPIVQAKEDGDITDVPVDAFRVEFYRQGELAEVAKNPLKNPSLLQEFLDRHLSLADLQSKESQLVSMLAQNSGQLIPMEGAVATLPDKMKALGEVNKKLLIAEQGKLKEIAADQTRLGNEKGLGKALADVSRGYALGISLKNFLRDYAALESTASPLTSNQQSAAVLQKIKTEIEALNKYLKDTESAITARLKSGATLIDIALGELKVIHTQLEQQLNVKVTELQKKGLSGNVADLQALIKGKSNLTNDIARLTGQRPQLDDLRNSRKQSLLELAAMRDEIMERRKAQLKSINKNLGSTIQDYTVFVHYEPRGIIGEFKQFILDRMQGSYFPENLAEQLGARITPARLAELAWAQDTVTLSAETGVDIQWTTELCTRLFFYTHLHALEVMWKPPCPVITVRTKATKPKDIPVNQLSDGQKHTIMLTIAMLAESNIPLVIDQPEDDLDNAFIFSTVVKTLRYIKERRQVILVTHNANIAVLGDAEMLFPMKRSGDGGHVFDSGSVDKTETKTAVLNILEGGILAFRRRQEIYGY